MFDKATRIFSSGGNIHVIISGYLQRSLTMAIYNKVFKFQNSKDKYIPVEIPRIADQPDIDELIKFLNLFKMSIKIKSAVISDPYKQVIIPFLDGLTECAKQIGAVNLVYKVNNFLIGENIDGEAFFLGSKYDGEQPETWKNVFLYGCGGVSSAVSIKLAPTLCKIGLVAFHRNRAEALANKILSLRKDLEVVIYDRNNGLDLTDYDVIYNGTGLGKYSYDPKFVEKTPLLSNDKLPLRGLAIDANYTPCQTKFLIRAKEQGLRTLNGFSHMVSFIFLHLNRVCKMKITYVKVRTIADEVFNESLKMTTQPNEKL